MFAFTFDSNRSSIFDFQKLNTDKAKVLVCTVKTFTYAYLQISPDSDIVQSVLWFVAKKCKR